MAKNSKSKSNKNKKEKYSPKTSRAKRAQEKKEQEKRKRNAYLKREQHDRKTSDVRENIEAVQTEVVNTPVEEEELPQAQETAEVMPEKVYVAPAEVSQPDAVKEKKPRRSKHTGLKVFAVLVLLLAYSTAFIAGAFALEKYVVNPDKYHDGTVINGVDVSGMTVDEAEDALTEEWNTHSIVINDTEGKEIGQIKDFGFKYDIDDQLEDAMKPGAERALLRFIKREGAEFTVKMDPAGNSESFKKQFDSLPIIADAVGDKPSKNAYIDKSDTEFRIVKEVIGNSVDLDKLRKAVFDSISRNEKTFEYRRSSYHKAPEIVSTSESLLKEREYCQKYLSFRIRLRNSVNDYTITPAWLDKMMTVKNGGKIKINEDEVDQFIADTLYPKFSSTGGTRTLRSAGGGQYTVSGGTYGFTVDTAKEHDRLIKELKAREDVEREPYYSGKAPNKDGKSDIGDDFVEVSIEKQTVWVVKGGKVKVETPVVTGVLPRHATPTGVFYIVYKATNTTLKGHNDDGSEYESHVAYWMPFYLGFGLHDANWRGAFGGSIYVYNGSHGCVNCPPSIMPKIFSLCYTGMPVIVH